jgi:ferredoxin
MKILALYFSGTGNTAYLATQFSHKMQARCLSIEADADFDAAIKTHDTIAFCYPIYMSNPPRIMREFAARHTEAIRGKKVIIFCTQWLLSGDGARRFAALFPPGHVQVVYAAHFFMPNNMNDLPFLPISRGKGIEKYRARTERKLARVCQDIEAGRVKRRGFGVLGRLLGLPQSAFLGATERRANHTVSVDRDCNVCGVCVKVCPTGNFFVEDGAVKLRGDCTMCYRCINSCPKKAVRVLVNGKVKRQYGGMGCAGGN